MAVPELARPSWKGESALLLLSLPLYYGGVKSASEQRSETGRMGAVSYRRVYACGVCGKKDVGSLRRCRAQSEVRRWDKGKGKLKTSLPASGAAW